MTFFASVEKSYLLFCQIEPIFKQLVFVYRILSPPIPNFVLVSLYHQLVFCFPPLSCLCLPLSSYCLCLPLSSYCLCLPLSLVLSKSPSITHIYVSLYPSACHFIPLPLSCLCLPLLDLFYFRLPVSSSCLCLPPSLILSPFP